MSQKLLKPKSNKMKIKCSLIPEEKFFNNHADKIAECHLSNMGIPYSSVVLFDSKTLELDIWDCCSPDYILKSLTEIFLDLGGVEIYWPDIFIEPITIY